MQHVFFGSNEIKILIFLVSKIIFALLNVFSFCSKQFNEPQQLVDNNSIIA